MNLRVKHKYIPAVLLLFMAAGVSFAGSKLEHTAGLELGFLSKTHRFDDPFGNAAGIGVYYEIKSSMIPFLSLGLIGSWYGFLPQREEFTRSSMFLPALQASSTFFPGKNSRRRVSVSLYLRYGHYFRNIVFLDSAAWYNRPTAGTGVTLDLHTGDATTFSFGILYKLFLDQDPIHLLHYTSRFSYTFPGRRKK